MDCLFCTLSRRSFLRAAIGTALVAGTAAATSRTTAQEAPRPAAEILAHGHAPYSDLVDGPAEVYTIRLTFPPGAIQPWHTHPGPVTAVTNSGELTIYQDLLGCKTTYHAGDALFIPLGMTHEEHNDGTETAEGIATFVVPEGSPLRVPADAPTGAAC